MKNSFLFLFLLAFCSTSIAQTASKNEEHCKYIISKKPEGKVKRHLSTFKITTLTVQQSNNLFNIIYDKSRSTYNIELNGNILNIYHINDISHIYLQELLISQGVFIEFNREVSIQSL